MKNEQQEPTRSPRDITLVNSREAMRRSLQSAASRAASSSSRSASTLSVEALFTEEDGRPYEHPSLGSPNRLPGRYHRRVNQSRQRHYDIVDVIEEALRVTRGDFDGRPSDFDTFFRKMD